jgi:hypothetical protein
MSPATIIKAVIGAFFLIGIAVGVVLVIAIANLRASNERAKRKLARRAGPESGTSRAADTYGRA